MTLRRLNVGAVWIGVNGCLIFEKILNLDCGLMDPFLYSRKEGCLVGNKHGPGSALLGTHQ